MIEDEIERVLDNVSIIEIYTELFKKRDFSFIVEGVDPDGNNVAHEKQREALEILTSQEYDEFLYGGAAGGAKSWTGVVWTMFMALSYPNTKYFIARNELKDIMDSVWVTWNKACRRYGFTAWKFNAVKNFIQLDNGSHINFIELKYKPSDSLYEDVGSTEYTAGWIEEVGEINEMGANVISTRVGRHMNEEYGIKGTVLYTCNPKKNWAKREFYDKDKNGQMAIENKDPEKLTKKYLGCLVTENPFIEKDYIKKLKASAGKNKANYERLFKGNWDYEENENALCDYEMIEQIFHNDHVPFGSTRLVADIARYGSDKARIGVFKGWRLVEHRVRDISKTTEIEADIMQLRRKHQIPKNRCLADEDGVGGGVVDGANIVGFRNNAKPLKEPGNKDQPNYKNLQVQCLYLLSDIINEGGLYVECELSGAEQEEIKQELDQIQSKNTDERKLDCKTKSDIIADIGRSPDWRDLFLMNVWFDLRPAKKKFVGSKKREVM